MRARELVAEALGTFAVVLALCGAQIVAGISASPVMPALAAGLAYVAMAATIGPVSGAHYNPAITLGALAGGRFESTKAAGYVVAQCLGAAAAIALLVVLVGASSKLAAGLALLPNGYAGLGLGRVLVAETVLTALVVAVFVAAGGRRSAVTAAPMAVGSALAAGYLLAIPISGGGLNPARSLATAVLGGGTAIAALWVFWVGPILGSIVGGVTARYLIDEG